MSVLSICFSGHARRFLDNVPAWEDYFRYMRTRHQVRVFFHSWSTVGSPRTNAAGHYVEGTYDDSHFGRFDEVTSFLKPNAYTIASDAPDLDTTIEMFPPALLTTVQASRRPLLSQLYSVNQADLLRQRYDRLHGSSDVVVKLRFDLRPLNKTFNEIDFLCAHPEAPVIFAPTPAVHGHPAGGGGCTMCHAFFDQNFRRPDFEILMTAYLAEHGDHINDICDLYAIAGPKAMTHYTGALRNAAAIYYRTIHIYRDVPLHLWTTEPDKDDPRDLRVLNMNNHPGGLEMAPFFYPEKILRFGLNGHVVVHAESSFMIHRG